MPTNRDVTRRALVKAGVVIAGEEPTADQVEDAMLVLDGLYTGLASGGALGRFSDVLATTDHTAVAGQRVRAAPGVTINLPPTFDGCPETAPSNLSTVSIVQDGAEALYVYDAGAWKALTGLNLDDECPFSGRSEDIAAMLAVEIAPEYGEAALSQIVLRQASRARAAFSSRADAELGPVPLTYY